MQEIQSQDGQNQDSQSQDRRNPDSLNQANRPEIAFNQPRRRDRAMAEEGWIEALLRRAPVGTLATAGERGPALNPNLFVYDGEERVLYLHTAKKGQTRSNLERTPRVAFSVAEMGRLLPAEHAVNFSVEFASVIAEGRATVVDEQAEARRALALFMEKYAPHLEMGTDYGGIRSKDLARTSVLKVEIESWSGKGKTSDAADAYDYEPAAGCPQAV